jgi:hypothetical protein
MTGMPSVGPKDYAALPELPIPWSDLSRVFTYENDCYRDIVITDADPFVWQEAYTYLRQLGRDRIATIETELDGKAADFPEDVIGVFGLIKARSWGMLKAFLDRIWISCHFFGVDRVELDMDPCDVKTAEDALSLMRFLRGLAMATDRPVHLTQEASFDVWWLTFDPSSRTWILDDWEFTPGEQKADRKAHQQHFVESFAV